jgi:hypothetical protein
MGMRLSLFALGDTRSRIGPRRCSVVCPFVAARRKCPCSNQLGTKTSTHSSRLHFQLSLVRIGTQNCQSVRRVLAVGLTSRMLTFSEQSLLHGSGYTPFVPWLGIICGGRRLLVSGIHWFLSMSIKTVSGRHEIEPECLFRLRPHQPSHWLSNEAPRFVRDPRPRLDCHDRILFRMHR